VDAAQTQAIRNSLISCYGDYTMDLFNLPLFFPDIEITAEIILPHPAARIPLD